MHGANLQSGNPDTVVSNYCHSTITVTYLTAGGFSTRGSLTESVNETHEETLQIYHICDVTFHLLTRSAETGK